MIQHWLFDRVMSQPGPMLRAWLIGKGKSPEEINGWVSQERRDADLARRDWSDPQKILAAARALRGHPRELEMGNILYALVQRHAPENLGWVPPEFHAPEGHAAASNG